MAKQVIDIGSTPGGATDDTVRDGFDKCNDNFTENYDAIAALVAVTATPCMGSKYTNFRSGIKDFQMKEVVFGELYYVSKIENYVGGKITVTINRTYTLASAGTAVMESAVTHAAMTGWQIVVLSAKNSSGMFGQIVIDWDEFTSGVSYTCATFAEGGLYSITTLKPGATGGGGGAGENFQDITDDTTDIDGSKDLYVIDTVAGKTGTLKAWASMKGTVRLKNVGGEDFTVLPASTEVFDEIGVAVVIAAGASCDIVPYTTDKYLVLGNDYTITPAP